VIHEAALAVSALPQPAQLAPRVGALLLRGGFPLRSLPPPPPTPPRKRRAAACGPASTPPPLPHRRFRPAGKRGAGQRRRATCNHPARQAGGHGVGDRRVIRPFPPPQVASR